jgi:hypothetical protein
MPRGKVHRKATKRRYEGPFVGTNKGLDYVPKRMTSPKEDSISAFKSVMPALGSFVASTFKVF